MDCKYYSELVKLEAEMVSILYHVRESHHDSLETICQLSKLQEMIEKLKINYETHCSKCKHNPFR